MAETYAEMFVMNESSVAMSTFLENLDDMEVKVPLYLLEPLIAVAKHTGYYGTTRQEIDSIRERLLANAKTHQ